MAINKSYIDIFAGCGGLSVGLFNAGWKGVFAIEKNPDAFDTLVHNLILKNRHFRWPKWLPLVPYDINMLMNEHSEQLRKLRGKITLVAGGPPCQGFSMAGQRKRNDQRNKLVKSYIDFISIVIPKAIIFENVYGFTVNFSDGYGVRNYDAYVEKALKRLGYNVAHRIIDLSNYGVPQRRHRFILIAMKAHDPNKVFQILENNRETFCQNYGIRSTMSVWDAISDLERSNGEDVCLETPRFHSGRYSIAHTGYQRLMRKGKCLTGRVADSHRFAIHKKVIIELHENLLANAPVGKRITPSDNIIPNLKRRGVTVLDAQSQSPTITSIPDELVHYKEPRILTVREHARIQSFPDWFEFKGKYTSGGKRRKIEVPRYTQVGNAVPPLFAEQVGLAILEVLSNGQE